MTPRVSALQPLPTPLCQRTTHQADTSLELVAKDSARKQVSRKDIPFPLSIFFGIPSKSTRTNQMVIVVIWNIPFILKFNHL